jgi:hypothetical protein
MAADLQKFHQYQLASVPKAEVEAFLKRHQLADPSPQIEWSSDLLACEDGIGVYFNPEEGQEMMMTAIAAAFLIPQDCDTYYLSSLQKVLSQIIG